MKQNIILLLGLVLVANSLYTSSFWTKQGINVKDQVFTEANPNLSFNVPSSCSDVNLTTPEYLYNGTVMSGYLSVNKGGSALGFIFYGR
jgi:hypothetical protein